jgi:uncharacterized protein (TIGR02217 family)
MSNAVFPVVRGLGWSLVKRPTFSTMSAMSQSNKEVRALNAQNPKWEFELTWNYLKDYDINAPENNPYTDFATILGFYLQRQGHFDSFLFDDPDDNTVVGQLIGTGDGTATKFQLSRNFGGFNEAIQAVRGTPVIRVNGVVKVVTTDFVVGSTGIVTFLSGAPAPAARVEADFSYYFRVTFKDDSLDFENFMNKLWELKTVVLTSDLQ